MAKKIKDIIKEETENFLSSPDEPTRMDEEYEPPRFIGSSIKADEEDRIIDELLASVPKNQGYYLKLYKEIRPNDFELKLRVDSFDAWSDLEWEITNLVRSYTLKQPQKWGSGHYRVIIWREGGIRGPKFRPLDFHIDAQEMDLTQNNGNGNNQQHLTQDDINNKIKEQFTSFGELVKTMKELNPSQSTSDIQSNIFEAFKTGLSIKEQSANNETQKEIAKESNNTQVLLELIRQNQPKQQDNSLTLILPELIKTLKDKPEPQPDKSNELLLAILPTLLKKDETPKQDPLDLLIKMKQAELIPSSTQQSPTDQLSKTLEFVSTLVPLIQNLGGGSGGDKPSALIEIIKILGPQIGGVVENVTSTVKEALHTKANMTVGVPTQYTPPQQPIPENRFPNPTNKSINNRVESIQQAPQQVPQQNPQVSEQNEKEQQMIFLFTKIKKAILSNDQSMYPTIQQLIINNVQEEMYEKIVNREIPLSTLADMIKPYITEVTTSQGLTYLDNFVVWAKQQEIFGKCASCNAEFTYLNEEHLNQNNKCDACHGTIEKVNQQNINESIVTY